MKRTLMFAALSCAMALTLLITGCQSQGSAQSTATAKDVDATVDVAGLSCPQCANTLKLIIDKNDAVASSTVDLGGGKVFIQFEQGRSLSADEIKALVKDSGFTPGKVAFTDQGGR